MFSGSPALELRWSQPGRASRVSVQCHLGDRAGLVRELQLAPDADDATVVGAAHRRWGRAAAARLVGPFGYAIAETGPSRVVLARDRMGQVPLYYARIPDGVVVSVDL